MTVALALVAQRVLADEEQMDVYFRVGRRLGLSPADVQSTVFLAIADPQHYRADSRGRRAKDPIARALEVESERQAVGGGDVAIVEQRSAALRTAVESTPRRRVGTRPLRERRAAARRQVALEAGQQGFAGLGWATGAGA